MPDSRAFIRSIDTEFESTIWQPFLKALKKYRLVENGDNIAVCISGGKDSMLLALLFKMLYERGIYDIGVRYIVMDPGYNAQNRQMIEKNLSLLEIDADIFQTDIFGSVENVKNNPCYLCARMRRGHLYKNAQDRGCNKIALGHHFDDVIETIMMSMLMSGQTRTMMPRVDSENFEGMQLIRPLYLVAERDIIEWRDKNSLAFIACACRFTEEIHNEDSGTVSKRQEVKELIAALENDIPNVRQNIFKSVENVDVSKLLSIKNDKFNKIP
ncbi:MAG: tRNA 2-thiocytidine biosynthesis protein TtcA [Ruminococcus sp.]|nr:tRNA 2-thiocytidine biosynthesis protein TtcA [Ruminococcus sp.]